MLLTKTEDLDQPFLPTHCLITARQPFWSVGASLSLRKPFLTVVLFFHSRPRPLCAIPSIFTCHHRGERGRNWTHLAQAGVNRSGWEGGRLTVLGGVSRSPRWVCVASVFSSIFSSGFISISFINSQASIESFYSSKGSPKGSTVSTLSRRSEASTALKAFHSRQEDQRHHFNLSSIDSRHIGYVFGHVHK